MPHLGAYHSLHSGVLSRPPHSGIADEWKELVKCLVRVLARNRHSLSLSSRAMGVVNVTLCPGRGFRALE